MKLHRLLSIACVGFGSLCAQPIEVRVVVLTMFEIGKPEGDQPGELQYWVERSPLPDSFDFPAGPAPLRFNHETGVLAVLTGMGGPAAAATVTALGFDPRFDLRRSYWLVAGIAGVDPLDASPGSAAWARWVIDGDLMHELDAREIPADWPNGIVALGATKPGEIAEHETNGQVVVPLNRPLAEWAYSRTKGVNLADPAPTEALRARYTEHPAAMAKPRVLLGESLCSSTYWHGARMSAWANQWVSMWTRQEGNYVMTAMEDQGTVEALKRLTQAGKADFQRLLVLRTASNFDQPPPGKTAAENVKGDYAGYLPSLEAAWNVGSVVVKELSTNWELHRDTIPGSR
jgi:purine nucleoside permease